MNQVPHACFSYPDDDLAQILKDRLHAGFGNARLIKRMLLPVSVIIFEARGCSFSVSLTKSRYKTDEWIALVGHLDNRSFLDRMFQRKVDQCVTELKQITHELHTILTEMPNISALRWYFQERVSSLTSVATADDLPWRNV
jgi:hypothetical protein